MTSRSITAVLALCAIQLPAAEIAHGPILGRLGATEIGVWARTKHEGEFRVRYGTSRGDLNQLSDPVRTTIDHDNANWVHITDSSQYQVLLRSRGRPRRPLPTKARR